MSSDSENISSASVSSSISSNSVEYHERESCIVQYNQHIDRMIEYVIINYPNLVIQDQRTRARKVYRDREREQGKARLMADYFVDNTVFDEVIFRCRFHMHKHLFFRIVDVVTANDQYLQQSVDATGRLSFSPLHKCTTVMRVLAYGVSFDVVDEYMRISEAVTRKIAMAFVRGVISCFTDKYLRRSNEDGLTRLLYVGEQHGFLSMRGSIDCMHWKWKNCPT